MFHFSKESLEQFDSLYFTPKKGQILENDLPDFLQSSRRKTPRPLVSDSFRVVSSSNDFDHLSFSDLSDSMQEDPHSPESDSTIYISSATPVSSRSHSFPTTPVKAPPRDLQSEILDKAAEFKAQGNACFENKKYTEAIELYSMAISYVPSDYVSFSNYVVSSLSQRQPSNLLPLAKQNCTCSERSFLYHAIESAIPAGILPSGKVLFPHRRPRKCARYVLERPGIGLAQR